jgi:hypothetical protein
MRIALLVFTLAACGDGRLHGSCDFGTQDGYTLCDDVAFSSATQKSLQPGLSMGHCDYFAVQSPDAAFGSFSTEPCRPGALGGCPQPSGKSDSVVRWFYSSANVTSSADVQALCPNDFIKE